MKKPRRRPPLDYVALRISPAMRNQLEDYAVKTQSTRSQVMRDAITIGLQKLTALYLASEEADQ